MAAIILLKIEHYEAILKCFINYRNSTDNNYLRSLITSNILKSL